MTSLIKIFRFKKPKEKRNEETRFSLRCSPVPTWRSSKDAIYIGGTSWSRPAAPYSVVTAPKKGRSTRSCPGGVNVTSSKQPLVGTISQQCTQYNEFVFTQTAVHDSRQLENVIKTSEYGSCEPSPTNASQALCTFADSDCDNEYVTQLQRCECELRKLKRRLKEERHRYREQIVSTQNDCEYMKRVAEKTTRALVVAQRAIESERHKNQSLRRRLRESDSLISELQCQLRHERLNREERNCGMAVGEGSLGAGEALCALSQSNANLYDSEFSTQQSNDLPDEVRNFRTANRCESPNVAAETSRSSTPTYEKNEVRNEYAVREINSRGDRQSRSSLRRSFSDSEIPALIAAVDDRNIPQRRYSPSRARSHIIARGLLPHHSEVDKEAKLLSSDEDVTTLELIGKQLRRRGDVVRFIPPRRTVRESTFRQFGRRERIALAEFDYLHELSTDASAIASSPDCARFSDHFQ
ncbi:unnamed protein product [Anisakis simplex]|uniref:Uncharacterized protein n=1 Tax=Anisakis simplex TaxID=6269 RepID=A0A0M3JTL7_ANISI|nr:unnamed protein product [Anisakis simplex]